MKFMKLGAKPDTFYTAQTVRQVDNLKCRSVPYIFIGHISISFKYFSSHYPFCIQNSKWEIIWESVISEVSSDFVIQVNDAKYLLHKFPLLSKCGRLQRLAAEACDSNENIIQLRDFPGGVEVFEFCAKFCYGITITVSPFNVVAVRCAAEYLQMTEAIEKGNLVFKLEVFLNSCIFHGWKDSIITLQSTRGFLPWAEDLKIVSRCIDAIACKALAHPSRVNWSYTYTRGHKDSQKTPANPSRLTWSGAQSRRHLPVPKDWWVEDISEFEIDLYWRLMVAIKSAGKVSSEQIGEALRVYAFRWLPGMSKEKNSTDPVKGNTQGRASDDYGEITTKHRLLLEAVVSLLPPEKGSASCNFLLKLLKATTILRASPSSKVELARRVGLQLEEASLNDILIPSLSYTNETLYDVDLVQTILEHFMMQSQSPPISPVRMRHTCEKRRSRSAENIDFLESRRSSSAAHSSKLKVAKLIDAYLAEIARDANLPLSKFISLAEAIPEFARPVHDDLYRAIDIYLKEHPGLNKSERKNICRLLDCKKLSVEACFHASQNELLPLRVVVQVLFFDQVRAAMSGGQVNESPHNLKALLSTREDESQEVPQSSTSGNELDVVNQNLKSPREELVTLKMRLAEADNECHDTQQEVARSSKLKNICSFPSKPKRIFSKLWSSNKSVSEK
eukprot:Gb_04489 [translate_table: standard]